MLIGCTAPHGNGNNNDVSSQETLELTTYELPNTGGDSNCVEGEIYTPHWILNHSAADYKAAGITAAQIEEKLPTYAQFLGAEHQDYTQLYTQKLNNLKALEK